jgi:hypothetical protein
MPSSHSNLIIRSYADKTSIGKIVQAQVAFLAADFGSASSLKPPEIALTAA